MNKKPTRRRGVILFTALVIAAIMMIWAVAATYQANFQTSATRHSYRKSELYYLAKRATSRAINQMNVNPNWASTHKTFASADTSTPNTHCWVETGTGTGAKMVLRCQASLGGTEESMSVPILADSDSDTHVYSITSAAGGGPDLIAWSTKNKATWESLPPIPGIQKILSTAPCPNGDVFAIGQLAQGTGLWRYRQGQGWVQMPDPPPNVSLSSLSAGGNERLACKGSDNSLMLLPLGTSQSAVMQWESVSPPAGVVIGNVAANPLGNALTYVTGAGSSGQVVCQYDSDSGNWASYPAPVARRFDAQTGAPTGGGGAVTDFSGGLVASPTGRLFAASNEGTGASVVYAFRPDAPGSTGGSWTAVPPLPALEWQGANVSNPRGYATKVEHLQLDEKGGLWAQSTNPDGSKFSIIRFPTPP